MSAGGVPSATGLVRLKTEFTRKSGNRFRGRLYSSTLFDGKFTSEMDALAAVFGASFLSIPRTTPGYACVPFEPS